MIANADVRALVLGRANRTSPHPNVGRQSAQTLLVITLTLVSSQL
jgi:hypothetical protein